MNRTKVSPKGNVPSLKKSIVHRQSIGTKIGNNVLAQNHLIRFQNIIS